MTDPSITAAALLWHSANLARLEAGAIRRKEQQRAKERTGYASASATTDRLHSEAKRKERAALRIVAKACAKSLHIHVIDVAATELTSKPVLNLDISPAPAPVVIDDDGVIRERDYYQHQHEGHDHAGADW